MYVCVCLLSVGLTSRPARALLWFVDDGCKGKEKRLNSLVFFYGLLRAQAYAFFVLHVCLFVRISINQKRFVLSLLTLYVEVRARDALPTLIQVVICIWST